MAWGIAALLALGGLLGARLLSLCERANGAEWGNRWLNRLDGLNRLFCRRYHRLQATALPLPKHGPALVAANHLSGLDALLLIAASPRPLRFVIATEQYRRFGLTWLFRAVGCIPVDRKGRPERAFRAARRALEAGEVVALFPQGGIHLDASFRPLKPGVARLSHLANCPVYPVRIEGVRGQGFVIRSLLLRSRVRLTPFAPVTCQTLSRRECLEAIRKCIVPHALATALQSEH